MSFQEKGRECRRQGQRIDRGDHGRDRDRDGELSVELPRETGNEGQWNEDGDKDV